MVFYTYPGVAANPKCLFEKSIGFTSGQPWDLFVYEVKVIISNATVWSFLKGYQQ